MLAGATRLRQTAWRPAAARQGARRQALVRAGPSTSSAGTPRRSPRRRGP
ncbi:MAG: hypothetical protein MZU84_04850 [Sphingobacterium sp.]|nr:hypothetical protein [Sphingobacterium sp.]